MMLHKTSQGPIYCEARGAGDPLLLVHADGASGLEFVPHLDRLGGYQLIVPDLPGHGRSPGRAFSSSYYPENAKAALDLARRFAPDRPLRVIGHSGGAVTALWMAILAPQTILKVVADSFVEFYRGEDLRGLMRDDRPRPPELPARPALETELSRVLCDLAEQNQSALDWRLEEVRCPVLLTGSRRDEILGNLSQRLLLAAEQIPRSTLLLYPEGHHPALHSMPERFFADALAFLAADG